MNFLVMMPAALLQALLVVPLDGRPVRFGVPLPRAAVATGLGLVGRGVLQWRRLPIGGDTADPVWVELAIVGPAGSVRIVPGAIGPSPDGRGPAFVREVEERPLPHGRQHTERWRWSDGSVDECVRTEFTAETALDGEPYAVGEWRTVAPTAALRAGVVLRLPRFGETVGLLPPRVGGGATTRRVRDQLARALDRLRELPGARGAGDFGRSDGVVTNQEFDTALGLWRCALGLRSERALQLALRAAQHLIDRDLDGRSGLPFPHGPDHRTGTPEPGHAWLQGLLWTGLVTANDRQLFAARQLARAIAASPPRGQGPNERLRDFAWPLGELEALLAFEPDPVLQRAADRLAVSIGRRFEGEVQTFCFGEGRVGELVYFERGWLTGGVLLPALRAHLRRRPTPTLAEHVLAVEQMLVDRIGRGEAGIPTHWRLAGGRVFAEHRARQCAEAAVVLDGLPPKDLLRLLQRANITAAIEATPCVDDPDLATQFSLLARCLWVWR